MCEGNLRSCETGFLVSTELSLLETWSPSPLISSGLPSSNEKTAVWKAHQIMRLHFPKGFLSTVHEVLLWSEMFGQHTVKWVYCWTSWRLQLANMYWDQWCAGKCLITSSLTETWPWFWALANVWSINTPALTNLNIWSYRHITECIVGSQNS